MASSSFFSLPLPVLLAIFFFFFNDTATTEIYTLSLHDALPILPRGQPHGPYWLLCGPSRWARDTGYRKGGVDRKSTRLNSSHLGISYAVFCLKKKNFHDPGTHPSLELFAHQASNRYCQLLDNST